MLLKKNKSQEKKYSLKLCQNISWGRGLSGEHLCLAIPSLSCALNGVLLFCREQRDPLCPAVSQVGLIAWMTQHRWPGYLFPTTPKSPCVPPAPRVTLPASSGREKRLGARSIPSCPSALMPELLCSLLVAFWGSIR